MKSEWINNYLKQKCESRGFLVLPDDTGKLRDLLQTVGMENRRYDPASAETMAGVIQDLRQQNRELHDRLLAVYAPTVAQTLPAMPSFQVDYRGPNTETATVIPPAGPVELPGTQVGDTE